MTVLAPEPPSTSQEFDLAKAQRDFEQALPSINRVISFRLRHLRGEKKEEESAEALALTWKYYLRLCEGGRDPMPYIQKVAEFGCRHVNRGGRLAGDQTTKDVMSRVAKHRSGHTVHSIVPKEDGDLSPRVADALRSREPSPADQAALNIDFQEFLDGLSDLDPRYPAVARQLAAGMTNGEVGREHGLSRGRISQFRERASRGVQAPARRRAGPVASMTSAPDITSQEAVARMQRDYEAALPRILRHARVKLRSIRDPGSRDDAMQDVVGIGWQHFVHCVQDGKDPNQFISAIAEYAVRQVRSGRHVTSQDRANDVLSPSAQRRRSFTVQGLPEYLDTGEDDNRTIDALADTRQATPADQAAFRIDTGDWLASLGAKRPIVEEMAAGEGTTDIAARHKKSQGRISQIRSEAAESYRRFHGDAGPGR